MDAVGVIDDGVIFFLGSFSGVQLGSRIVDHFECCLDVNVIEIIESITLLFNHKLKCIELIVNTNGLSWQDFFHRFIIDKRLVRSSTPYVCILRCDLDGGYSQSQSLSCGGLVVKSARHL